MEKRSVDLLMVMDLGGGWRSPDGSGRFVKGGW